MIPTVEEAVQFERGNELTAVIRHLVQIMEACSPTPHELDWLIQEVRSAMNKPEVETVVDRAKRLIDTSG